MEQINTIESEVLWNILANPADAKYAYTLNMQSLVDEFPQSGLFRALLAGNGSEQSVRHAAVYFNPVTLHKLINAPDDFQVVTAQQIFQIDALPVEEVIKPLSANEDINKFYEELNIPPVPVEKLTPVEDYDVVNHDIVAGESKEDHFSFAEDIKAEQEEPIFESATAYTPVEQETVFESAADFNPAEQEIVSAIETTHVPVEQEVLNVAPVDVPLPVQQEETPAYAPIADTTVYENIAREPVADAIPLQQENIEPVKTEEPGYIYPYTEKTEYFHQDIDDEIYDEIVSIEDINLKQLEAYDAEPRTIKVTDTGDKVSFTDHFVFETEVNHWEEEDTHPNIPAIIIPANEVPVSQANRRVSRYNDEKMPYSFMWWLDKTRREHAAAYQPYVNNPEYNSAHQVNTRANTYHQKDEPIDELQQQYIENIFNINAIDQLERIPQKIGEQPHERKEDKIIKRFIEAEPQIKHSDASKLDNENKAKKSSEDSDELITETLARIYTEQMLYSKAMVAYKKLMLKFPEKSLYFASQIEQLEKKPN